MQEKNIKGKILLATVKGDVHDIGKNIVGVVLGCNNYEVIDMGVMVPCEKILEKVSLEKVDILGLSGLITPSLDEMVHVAKEMERLKFKIPLLIGGATTSRVHTAVKIEPNYSGATIHVLDASRSVTVAGNILSSATKEQYENNVRKEYEVLRLNHQGKKAEKNFLDISEARKNRLKIKWSESDIYKPRFTGIKTFDSYPLDEIRNYIDWTPFFLTWEMKGKYPEILSDKRLGAEAKKLYDDAQKMLDAIVHEKWLTAKAVIGIWAANSVADDMEIYLNGDRGKCDAVLHTLRQQLKKADGQPNLALADFIAPKETGFADYIGGFAVTSGHGIERLLEKFKKEHDDYNSILLKALADRLAEAFAELMHKRVRKELWGFAENENLSDTDLLKEIYQGIRPAAGYPACPDHTEKRIIFDLLKAEEHTGIILTESFAMYPASSVSGLYFAHPESKYFGLGKIGKDQIEEYAARKGFSVEEAEKWLAPNLNYG